MSLGGGGSYTDTLRYVKSVSLLLTQTRVSVEKSHGSRYPQQVERKGPGEFDRSPSLKPSPFFIEVCCVGRGFVGDKLFLDARMKCLE